jgi:hypothetical protein
MQLNYISIDCIGNIPNLYTIFHWIKMELKDFESTVFFHTANYISSTKIIVWENN